MRNTGARSMLARDIITENVPLVTEAAPSVQGSARAARKPAGPLVPKRLVLAILCAMGLFIVSEPSSMRDHCCICC